MQISLCLVFAKNVRFSAFLKTIFVCSLGSDIFSVYWLSLIFKISTINIYTYINKKHKNKLCFIPQSQIDCVFKDCW